MQKPSKRHSRPYSRAEHLADATIHVLGVGAALIAVPVMVTLAAVWRDDGWLVAAIAIYGVTLLIMLAASAGYNIASIRLEGGRLLEWLRRVDHGAIYVKIAGTYTPYAVIAGGPLGRWMLIGVWTGALVGVLNKLVAPDRWQRASLLLYLALGWCFVLVAGPVSAEITGATMALIVVGGLLYTVGVIFHLWEKLPFQNAIWHLFVLVASFVFYSAMVVEISVGT
ncbi:MAG: hemolysin III family protein [Pseudomonadota bacterium]